MENLSCLYVNMPQLYEKFGAKWMQFGFYRKKKCQRPNNAFPTSSPSRERKENFNRPCLLSELKKKVLAMQSYSQKP